MPEIDMRNNYLSPGIPMDQASIARDIYFLLCIFAASREMSQRRCDDNDEGSVYGYGLRNYELPEVGRLVVSLAAVSRNYWDASSRPIEEALRECDKSADVGTLVEDTSKGHETSLKIRESWNKILHCDTMNFSRSNTAHIYAGYLEPTLHLYGEHRGKTWKASLDIYRWCETVHALA